MGQELSGFRPTGCVRWPLGHLHNGFSSRQSLIPNRFTAPDTCLNSEKGGLYFLSTAEFPARFQLVAAMNPCPCGFAGTRSGKCNCSAEQVQRYLARISGPLLDRIDIRVAMMRPRRSVLELQKGQGESSGAIRERVVAARAIQIRRNGCPNALLGAGGIRIHCALDEVSLELLADAALQLELSPRACHRILRLARTIADLDSASEINAAHMAEAIALRRPGVSPASSR